MDDIEFMKNRCGYTTVECCYLCKHSDFHPRSYTCEHPVHSKSFGIEEIGVCNDFERNSKTKGKED